MGVGKLFLLNVVIGFVTNSLINGLVGAEKKSRHLLRNFIRTKVCRAPLHPTHPNLLPIY